MADWNNPDAPRWDREGYGAKSDEVQRGIDATMRDMIRRGGADPHQFQPLPERKLPPPSMSFYDFMVRQYGMAQGDGDAGAWVFENAKGDRRDAFKSVDDPGDLVRDHGVERQLAYAVWERYEAFLRRWW